MASSNMTMPRAMFEASMVRPDPISLSRDELAPFYQLLDKAMVECTPTNVQACRQWLQPRVFASSSRLQAFGKLLTAFSTTGDRVGQSKQASNHAGFTKLSSAPATSNTQQPSTQPKQPSLKRKRLHALYLVDDLLSHAHDQQTTVVKALEPTILQLTTHAAGFSRSKAPKHHEKLTVLLTAWQTKNFPQQLPLQVQHAYNVAAAEASPDADKTAAAATIEAPWIMPAQHGDSATPWCDQPAGAFINALTPADDAPIPHWHVQPVPLPAGPAPPEQIAAVRALLQAVNDDHADLDLDKIAGFDSLGQPLIKDPITGEAKTRGNYYGWSDEYSRLASAIRERGPVAVREEGIGWLKTHQPPPPPPRPRSPPRRGGHGGWRGGNGQFSGPPGGYGNYGPPPPRAGMGSRGQYGAPRGARGRF